MRERITSNPSCKKGIRKEGYVIHQGMIHHGRGQNTRKEARGLN